MDFWYFGESSLNTEKEPIIRDMVYEFSEDDEQEEYIPEEHTFPILSNHNVQSFSRATRNIHFDLSEGMSFNSNESTLNAIKQYHIDQGYNFMVVESKPNKWLQAIQDSVPGTIVQYITCPYVVDGVEDQSNYILECVFWSFKPCIEGFKYCKPIVQVDGTFLTGKYHDTLLIAINQDGNLNIFSLAFTIVEGETKEALIWFSQLLQEYVTSQSNLCMITDRGTTILLVLQSPEVASEEDGLTSMYCIRHIASNFNKWFKNVELKRKVINVGYEMKQPTLQAKLSAIRAEFPHAVFWIDQIPLEKWTQAYDGGKRYGRENSDFDVEDMLITELRHYLTTYTVKLNEWWCDYEEIQAICLPCPYVIAVCSFCHLQLTTFVAPVYSVHNIFKAYEVQFNPVRNQDYWSTYTGPNLLPDPMMHQHQLGRPNTQRIHKEMDDSIPNKPKKCSYCRTEGHN
ncbi:uncharacterized protein [Phaseolus vulgaris]|uniref:uncharacterized protein n=1 Tax=Phaseolus vulgaris TaxID=3885 RepID=UPI0035C946B4